MTRSDFALRQLDLKLSLGLLLFTTCLMLCLQLSACGGGSSEQPEQAEQRQSPAAFLLEQQALLESMPIPEGMNEAAWQELKSAARSMLDSIKATLAAPITIPSGAKLTLSDDTLELAWGYACQGDYDQNSEVNIADLAPLGSNFGASSGGGPFPAGSLLSMVDGDGNGEINISDISPIGTNFGRRVGSYNVYRSLSFSDVPTANGGPNGPGAELLGSVLYAEATGNRTAEQLRFSFTLPELKPGWFYFVRPADGASEGTPSNVVSFGAKDGNLDPVASLLADPSSGDTPLTVNFDASGSLDPDGANGDITDIVQFLWDFDGDGLADESTSTPLVTHIYNQPGSFNATVGAFDAAAGLGSTSVAISVGQAGNLPPVAAISASPTSGQAPLPVGFDASATSDDGGPGNLTFEWDLDDDGVFEFNTGTSFNTFQVFLEGGSFSITVKVTDLGGLSDTASVDVSVDPPADNVLPIAVLEVSQLSGLVPLNTSFSSAASSDPDGQISLFELDFEGDGVFDRVAGFPQESITHTYEAAGTFNATLRVTDNRGGTATDTVTVTVTDGGGNAPPFARFDGSPTFGDTPLSVDFDAADSIDPDGTIASYQWDFDNDGSFDELSVLPTIQHTYLTAGNFKPRLRVTDNIGATADVFEATIIVRNPDNLLPDADLAVNRISGSFPEEFEFDGSSSSDPDGSIVKYEWDFDGDGEFDLDSGSTAIVTHKVHQNGSFTPMLRVTDNEFDTSTGEGLSYDVSTGWQTVDIVNLSFELSDLDSVSVKFGVPVQNRMYVAYSVVNNQTVKVVHSNDGLSWSTPSPVSSEPSAFGLALINVNNKPGLFYSRAGGNGSGGLSYVLASNQDANVWSSPLSVSSGGQNETSRVNAAKAGNPAAVFYSPSGQFVRALDGSGSTFASAIPTFSLSGFVLSEDFAVISGSPAIAVHSGQQLLYARATAADGSSWPASMTVVDDQSLHDGFNSNIGMTIVDGNPAIAYPITTAGLGFVRALDANGDAWGTTQVIPGTETLSIRDVSVIKFNGFPAIVFSAGQDVSSSRAAVYVQAIDPAGTSWGELEFVDTIGDTGFKACVGVVGGSRVITYEKLGAKTLRAAVR
jgi:PKD repeat protein